ncbi:ribosome maturation factor RimP [soil metagenome]
MAEDLGSVIAERVEALGYEFVEFERAGTRARPILRVRIDVQGGSSADSGADGVSVDDCSRVSRALEERLDESPDLSERYVLEVSSPGVERPLVRSRDFERFAGREISVRTGSRLPNGSRRAEGELLGLVTVNGEERIRLRQSDGADIDIPRADVARAHLIFRWKDRR